MLVDDNPKKLEVASAFHTSLTTRDWVRLRGLFTDDATWTLPGENTISGHVVGADAMVERAQKIASYGLNFALECVLISHENVALLLHNTAKRDGVVLDERLTAVCRLRDDRIAEIETFLSDVRGMNAFFQ